MRAAMAPGKGSRKSAVDLMKESVVAFRSASRDNKKHFFEVKLEGFTDAPKECRSASAMYDFVSQVAPIPYPDDFLYLEELREAAQIPGILIEEVPITIKKGTLKPTLVKKRYGSSYEFESGTVTLNDCAIHHSPNNLWWAWVGKKSESGSYTDSRVSGLRVRVRNIQIDGTAIVGNIFRSHARSYERFQDYFLGEIFIEPSAIVPNARRDGFEEDAAWKGITEELATVVKALGREAHRVSNKGQRSVETLRKKLQAAKKELRALRKITFSNTDRVIKFTKSVTTSQTRVAQGALGAAMETAAELQAIGSAFADMKQEALSHVAGAALAVDREKVQQEARDDYLREILSLLEETLSPGCFEDAKEALMAEFGED